MPDISVSPEKASAPEYTANFISFPEAKNPVPELPSSLTNKIANLHKSSRHSKELFFPQIPGTERLRQEQPDHAARFQQPQASLDHTVHKVWSIY